MKMVFGQWRISTAIIIAPLVFTGAGCTGTNTFGLVARPGDTVVLALGWQQGLTRQDIKVSILDSNFTEFVYLPGDPAVRAIINTYPDPVSKLIVGTESGQPNFEGATTGVAANLIDSTVTGGGKDYSQAFMILDLPPGMSVGSAVITVTDPVDTPISNPSTQVANINPINLEIVDGIGQTNAFDTQEGLTVLPGYLAAMERASHNTISFQGVSTPYAIQLELMHNPDMDNGGAGKAYVVNTRGDLLSLNWFDDGVGLKVILLPARGQALPNLNRFKFYVAGGVTGLTLGNVSAYDVNGNTVPGIVAVMN